VGESDLTWLIGGPQGGGINQSAEGFARAAARAGYRVIANIEYHSNIMGEHSYYRVRVGKCDRRNLSERVHVLVALDDETLVGERHAEFPGFPGHVREVVPGGAVVYDSNVDPGTERDDVLLCPVPYLELLEEALRGSSREGQAGRLKVMTNTVAVGASLALLGFDLERYQAVLREEFSGRRAELGELNAKAAALGYRYVLERFASEFPYRLPTVQPPRRPPLLIRGPYAAAIGKLKAGLAFQTYYPISPATDENVYLEAHQRDQGLVVVQTEDEVSAINMAVGAAHAGVRASTSTSGPGFSLMVEGLGFAAMTEAPGPVVVLWQRGGPSTGLPTREEQADLRFALQPGHGEFPHIVVAPGDVEEIVADCYEAFNWADRYQLPVVVLVDKVLGTTYVTLDDLHLDRLPPVDRGPRFTGPAAANGLADGALHPAAKRVPYLRYDYRNGPVTPRAIPGQEGGIFWSTTDEHDPRGHITEDAENRIRMQEKRMAKLDLALREIPAERAFRLHGPADADVTVVGWGSTKGAILDALDILAREDGVRANFLQVRLMRPFPAAGVARVLRAAKRTVLVEVNYTGQLGLLIREQTGIALDQQVLKYDGRPFSEEELLEGLRTALRQDGAAAGARLVVSHRSA
jgi:2-oxoglutarate ferredoxin oxidoreductase subunit alpha